MKNGGNAAREGDNIMNIENTVCNTLAVCIDLHKTNIRWADMRAHEKEIIEKVDNRLVFDIDTDELSRDVQFVLALLDADFTASRIPSDWYVYETRDGEFISGHTRPAGACVVKCYRGGEIDIATRTGLDGENFETQWTAYIADYFDYFVESYTGILTDHYAEDEEQRKYEEELEKVTKDIDKLSLNKWEEIDAWFSEK